MLIYLIGYMGCGKTTAGKRLANKLNYNLIDLDELIETEQGKTISELFASIGQDAFREIEKSTLHSTFAYKNTVIATGGGAPCFFDNVEQMNKHGQTFYIKLTPKALVNRLKSAKDERPLIAGKSDTELLHFIENALIAREPFYKKASFTVNGIGLNIKSFEKHLL